MGDVDNQVNDSVQTNQEAGTGDDGPDFWPGMAQLPNEFKRDEEIAETGSFGGLAQAYKDTKAELIKMTDIPEDPNEYELPEADFPEGMEADEEVAEAFLKKAHELKLSKAQAAGMQEFYNSLAVEDYNNRTAEQREKQSKIKKSYENTLKGLQNEYGNELKGKLELARRVLHGVLFDGKADVSEEEVKKHPLLTRIDDAIGSDPAFLELMKVFIKIGETNREDSWIGSEGLGSSGAADGEPNYNKIFPSMKGIK